MSVSTSREWKPFDSDENWLKDNRGHLGTIANVIATMSIQNVLNPPGGFVQNGNNGSVLCPTPMVRGEACPGQSIFAAVDPVGYIWFMLVNIISFVISVITFIILVTGISLKPGTLFLIVVGCLCISLSLLIASFGISFRIMNPRASEIIGAIASYGSFTAVLIFSSIRVFELIQSVANLNRRGTPRAPDKQQSPGSVKGQGCLTDCSSDPSCSFQHDSDGEGSGYCIE
ncbi:hypothetical protein PIB30_062533 [Stylosanthes scabra]|uniref:PGG domain-containing protein n=1 Tax=Stylosanthes scabra TaxID=79078 RepID=A0ABU6SL52_9FABA|nr:hypothetical protein [Stylosanthes scabra]